MQRIIKESFNHIAYSILKSQITEIFPGFKSEATLDSHCLAFWNQRFTTVAENFLRQILASNEFRGLTIKQAHQKLKGVRERTIQRLRP